MSAFASLSPQHQLVILHYRANGRVQHEAWTAAGYEARSARSGAARFFNTPEAIAALAELDGQTMGKLRIDGDTILQRLAQIMHGNMADFVTVGEDGKAALNLKAVTREQWAAVSQVKVAPDGSVTLKLYDARAAAVDLGKHAGLFKNRLGDLLDDSTDDSESTPDRDLARRVLLAFALTMGKGGKNGAQTPTPIKH